MEIITIIEARDKFGKLHDFYFDETEFYIQRSVDRMKDDGYTEFSIVKNPKGYNIEL